MIHTEVVVCTLFLLDINLMVKFIKFSSGPSPVCKNLMLVIDNIIKYIVVLGFKKNCVNLVIFLVCLKKVVIIFKCAATVTVRRCPRT